LLQIPAVFESSDRGIGLNSATVRAVLSRIGIIC